MRFALLLTLFVMGVCWAEEEPTPNYALKIIDPCAQHTIKGEAVPAEKADKPVLVVIQMSRTVANETDNKTKPKLDKDGKPVMDAEGNPIHEKVPLTANERLEHYLARAQAYIHLQREALQKADPATAEAAEIEAIREKYRRLKKKPEIDAVVVPEPVQP